MGGLYTSNKLTKVTDNLERVPLENLEMTPKFTYLQFPRLEPQVHVRNGLLYVFGGHVKEETVLSLEVYKSDISGMKLEYVRDFNGLIPAGQPHNSFHLQVLSDNVVLILQK